MFLFVCVSMFFFKQKTAYEMRISDWSSDVCSSDLMAQVPGAIVGAGTVLNPKQLDQAMEAGAQFIVSPGLTKPLGKAAVKSGIAFLPGTATAGDIMRGMDMGQIGRAHV